MFLVIFRMFSRFWGVEVVFKGFFGVMMQTLNCSSPSESPCGHLEGSNDPWGASRGNVGSSRG